MRLSEAQERRNLRTVSRFRPKPEVLRQFSRQLSSVEAVQEVMCQVYAFVLAFAAFELSNIKMSIVGRQLGFRRECGMSLHTRHSCYNSADSQYLLRLKLCNLPPRLKQHRECRTHLAGPVRYLRNAHTFVQCSHTNRALRELVPTPIGLSVSWFPHQSSSSRAGMCIPCHRCGRVKTSHVRLGCVKVFADEDLAASFDDDCIVIHIMQWTSGGP